MSNKKKIRLSKRIFDIVSSLVILLLTLPFLLFTLLAIKIEQIFKGGLLHPVFYSETRMAFGRQFTLYKFNIFKYEQVINARIKRKPVHTKDLERNGGTLKVGWLLKQIYMDELPQFFNVLKGDLSIVGPRPVNLEVYEALMKRNVTDKNRVPGGITGNYQSNKETSGAKADELDREYADYYHSEPWYKLLLFDLKIILRTIKVILMARGV